MAKGAFKIGSKQKTLITVGHLQNLALKAIFEWPPNDSRGKFEFNKFILQLNE